MGLTYLDDVLIKSVYKETHKMHLEQVFQRIKEAGLALKVCYCLSPPSPLFAAFLAFCVALYIHV